MAGETRLRIYECVGKRSGRLASLGNANLPSKSSIKQNKVSWAGMRGGGGAFVNAQGVRRKVPELTKVLHDLDLDLIGIAETWLLPGEEIQLEGYSWLGVPREGRVGRGGVGLLVREGYDVKLLGTGVGEEGLEQDNGVEIM